MATEKLVHYLEGMQKQLNTAAPRRSLEACGVESELAAAKMRLQKKLCVEVYVRLEPPIRTVHVPVARDEKIIERSFPSDYGDVPSNYCDVELKNKNVVNSVVGEILKERGRVFLHGLPGVGKDAVAAMVVKHADVRKEGGTLQAWLQASSETVLQKQLVELFVTHRPEVLRNVEEKNDLKACIETIKKWLSTEEEEWLFVFEDTSKNSKTVWDILSSTDRGRVLLTSQEPLDEKIQDAVQAKLIYLPAFEIADSIKLLLSIGGKELGDDKWNMRKEDRMWSLADLTTPEVEKLLGEDLGNLPLSIAMVGSIMLKMVQAAKKETTKTEIMNQMIEEFQSVETGTMEVKYRSKVDRHYLGLTRSVLLAVRRLQGDEAKIEGAKGLLIAMSMLHRSETPLALLLDHGNEAQVCALPFGSSRMLHSIAQSSLRDVCPHPVLKQCKSSISCFPLAWFQGYRRIDDC
jgi:hypothetical protein